MILTTLSIQLGYPNLIIKSPLVMTFRRGRPLGNSGNLGRDSITCIQETTQGK